jgi:hypothetical protein
MAKDKHTKPVISLPLVITLTMLLFVLAGVIMSIDKQPAQVVTKAKEPARLLTRSVDVKTLENDLLLLGTDPIEQDVQVLNSMK